MSQGQTSSFSGESPSVNQPDHSVLYVVTRSTQKFTIGGRNNPAVGLFTTSDRGVTWRHYGWEYTKCFSVAIQPGSSGKILYLSCGNGIQKSVDDGEKWQIVTDWRMTECLKVAIDPQNPHTVYAATAYGIFKSSDGGKTWREKNRGFESTFTSSVIIVGKKLFAATEAGVYISTDGAENWQLAGLEGKGSRTILQSPHSGTELVAGTEDDGVFFSFDGGVFWRQKNNGLHHRTIYALAFDPADANIIYAGTFRGGVYKSGNGGNSWQSRNEGLTNLSVHALCVDPFDHDVVYCGTLGGGVFISENAGANWRFIGLETSQVWDFVIK
ncbi:MAG TPA: hypothetical protein ENH29_02135 [Bacteroidetes bacterium]|nr:hypothetical protein [Bacteroidota bacterium]